MNLQPSYATSVVAGLITSIGITAYDLAAAHFHIEDKSGMLWLVAAAVFFVLPVYLLVLGKESKPIGAAWLNDPAERAKQWAILKRGLVWFVTAGAVMLSWARMA